jgi:CheY-like chemotaxis protein
MDDNRRVVLLVDDEAAIRRLVRSALAGLDCEVVERATALRRSACSSSMKTALRSW